METHHSKNIELIKVATNNLKKIDASFPLGKITVVTGVSGSGKSSLVFDTLYRESYRRYLESLSSFERQFLQTFPRPELENVRNLPPAIAVRQARNGTNKRSTVGTLTELQDLVQLLFTHLGVLICQGCGSQIDPFEPLKITEIIIEQHDQEQITIAAPLSSWNQLKDDELKKLLIAQGFTRVIKNGEIAFIENGDFKQLETLDVIVDRIKISSIKKDRIVEALAISSKLGAGRLNIWKGDTLVDSYSNRNECQKCKITYPQAKSALFSYNHPLGACTICQGFGREIKINWQKVFPDPEGSIQSRSISPLNFGRHDSYYQEIECWAKKRKISFKKPFKEYSKNEWNEIIEGDGKNFNGINGYFKWLDTKKYKQHYRIHKAKYTMYVICHHCKGKKYSQRSEAYQIRSRSISDVRSMSVEKLKEWAMLITSHDLRNNSDRMIIEEGLKDIKNRLFCLSKIGLSYLSLEREADTLSGGELQRINIARCLGSSLTDTLFCLDEPTVGLHPHDTEKLMEILKELKDKGNTIVMVEHDPKLIQQADECITVGPGAGHLGGEIVNTQSSENYFYQPKIESFESYLILQGAQVHNLKGDQLKIPLGCIVGVCGVSGSGKTSLIQHSLYPAISNYIGQKDSGKNYKNDEIRIQGNYKISKIASVTQSPLARSSRSNLLTFLGLYTVIRKLMAIQPVALKNNFSAGSFSFNVPGGRCEICKGMGTVVEDLSFLGEMELNCPECNGDRFQNKLLEVTYKNKNILDILNMTVCQAREFFYDFKEITDTLDQVIDVGLGYLLLGQATSSYSGGESQRLKLLKISQESVSKKSICFLFDEPTSGLSRSDVCNLMKYFRKLTKLGHSFVVIEHNLDLLRNVDYIVEMGPKASEAGGRIIFQGPFSDFIKSSHSVTNLFVKQN